MSKRIPLKRIRPSRSKKPWAVVEEQKITAQEIRSLRTRLNRTARGLAEVLGVSEQTLYRWEKGAKLLENAKIEEGAFTWLLDHGFREIENVIFYDHTQTFCFGWRDSLKNNPPRIDGFPFNYEVK